MELETLRPPNRILSAARPMPPGEAENGFAWYRPMRTRGTSKYRRGSLGTKTRMAKLRLWRYAN